MKHLLELFGFLVISLPIAILPLGLSLKAGELGALALYHLFGKRRRIVLDNLMGVVERTGLRLPAGPEDTVREIYRNLGRSASEIFKVCYGFDGRLVRGVDVEGLEHFESAKCKGRGVIVITGHCGNWELFGVCVSTKIGTTWGAAKRQKNPYFNAMIERVRQRFESHVVYQDGLLRKFMSVLKESGTVGLVIDQVMRSDEGQEIRFLGGTAWTSKVAASLARRTSAVVIPAFIRRTAKGHVIRLHPELDLTGDEAADTQKIMDSIEGYIMDNPTEWLEWVKRWKITPSSGL
jgi:KDO2-lipid IV(A) lauroyltransferase